MKKKLFPWLFLILSSCTATTTPTPPPRLSGAQFANLCLLQGDFHSATLTHPSPWGQISIISGRRLNQETLRASDSGLHHFRVQDNTHRSCWGLWKCMAKIPATLGDAVYDSGKPWMLLCIGTTCASWLSSELWFVLFLGQMENQENYCLVSNQKRNQGSEIA